jgi:hypothetical protein
MEQPALQYVEHNRSQSQMLAEKDIMYQKGFYRMVKCFN